MVSKNSKPHLVLVPYPAQGHITPFLKLAKLLHSRNFHVTFVNTEFNHRRLLCSRSPVPDIGLPDDFQFRTIPDGLPPSDKNATQDVPALCDSLLKNCLGPFKDLLVRLGEEEESPPYLWQPETVFEVIPKVKYVALDLWPSYPGKSRRKSLSYR